MRHPAAPTIIAVLLGFLVLVVVYHALVSDGHHEGNPHPDDVPRKEIVEGGREEEEEEEKEEEKEEEEEEEGREDADGYEDGMRFDFKLGGWRRVHDGKEM